MNRVMKYFAQRYKWGAPVGSLEEVEGIANWAREFIEEIGSLQNNQLLRVNR